MTGKDFFERYQCNPDSIAFESTIYTESDLASMDNTDYDEIMEFGTVEE